MEIRISQQANDSIPEFLLQTCLARSRQRFDEDRLRISPEQKVAAKGILAYLGVTDQELNVSSYLQGTLTVVATPTCLATCLTDELPRPDADRIYTRHAMGRKPFVALCNSQGIPVALGQGIPAADQAITIAGKQMTIEDGQHRGRPPSTLRDSHR